MQGSDLTMQVEPISYRQWLIGMALQGAVASTADGVDWPISKMAEYCFNCADAIIDRLNKEDKQ